MAIVDHHATTDDACLIGAELISVVNSDENKTFGAVFRTPVDDSTGTDSTTHTVAVQLLQG